MPATSAAYARLSAVFPGLRITAAAPPPDGGWVCVAELARGGPALAAFVAGDARRLTGAHGARPRPDVAAALALHRYLWPACLLFTVPWFLHRRVPRLPVGDVGFHPASGRFTARTRTFACLPQDAAAALPGARAVASPDALREELRAALDEHLTAVLAGFAPLLRRGPRALWRSAHDEITEGLWYIGRLLGEEDRAVAELSQLLPGKARFAAAGPAGPAARTGSAGPDAPADAASRPARERLTCCLFYTVSPSGTCAGCPRTRASGRIRSPASAV
ncbi:(2Fe-2S)-binding protein [Streptomyces sp. V4-01]|uniref:(2Fe-2S)-binding protein n=1 Tax=Actinacidiphila polyblastidii TaxID=3110430 RepID=A0ABU7PA24_9ACTN|nr:(2Fe-2S)-binding protein [Streptomyces sp. V4-01]